MCTVSFIKHKEGFSLTSNRDEQSTRPTAEPKIYEEKNQQLTYPKDKKAGGTWIATSSKNTSVCLLNGAFKNHKKQPSYAKSRGIVLKERFEYKDNTSFIHNVELTGVEPFTLLMVDHDKGLDFMELVWDGKEKHFKQIDTTKNHIWASATLYSEQQRQNRKKWFEEFLKNNKDIKTEDIISFHTGSFTDDKANDMLMQRDKALKTISVSQINIKPTQQNFIYKDLETNKSYHLNLNTSCQTV